MGGEGGLMGWWLGGGGVCMRGLEGEVRKHGACEPRKGPTVTKKQVTGER